MAFLAFSSVSIVLPIILFWGRRWFALASPTYVLYTVLLLSLASLPQSTEYGRTLVLKRNFATLGVANGLSVCPYVPAFILV